MTHERRAFIERWLTWYDRHRELGPPDALLEALAELPATVWDDALRRRVRQLGLPVPSLPDVVGAMRFPTWDPAARAGAIHSVRARVIHGADALAQTEPGATAAAAAALDAVRRCLGTDDRFALTWSDGDWSGASCGLAVALAAWSAVTGEPLRADTCATGRVDVSGDVRPVAHVPEKLGLCVARSTRLVSPSVPVALPATAPLVVVDNLEQAFLAAQQRASLDQIRVALGQATRTWIDDTMQRTAEYQPPVFLSAAGETASPPAVSPLRVFGAPGAGKSIWLASWAAGESDAAIVVVVPCGDLDGSLDALPAWLARVVGDRQLAGLPLEALFGHSASPIAQLREERKLIVALDGLDELPGGAASALPALRVLAHSVDRLLWTEVGRLELAVGWTGSISANVTDASELEGVTSVELRAPGIAELTRAGFGASNSLSDWILTLEPELRSATGHLDGSPGALDERLRGLARREQERDPRLAELGRWLADWMVLQGRDELPESSLHQVCTDLSEVRGLGGVPLSGLGRLVRRADGVARIRGDSWLTVAHLASVLSRTLTLSVGEGSPVRPRLLDTVDDLRTTWGLVRALEAVADGQATPDDPLARGWLERLDGSALGDRTPWLAGWIRAVVRRTADPAAGDPTEAIARASFSESDWCRALELAWFVPENPVRGVSALVLRWEPRTRLLRAVRRASPSPELDELAFRAWERGVVGWVGEGPAPRPLLGVVDTASAREAAHRLDLVSEDGAGDLWRERAYLVELEVFGAIERGDVPEILREVLLRWLAYRADQLRSFADWSAALEPWLKDAQELAGLLEDASYLHTSAVELADAVYQLDEGSGEPQRAAARVKLRDFTERMARHPEGGAAVAWTQDWADLVRDPSFRSLRRAIALGLTPQAWPGDPGA